MTMVSRDKEQHIRKLLKEDMNWNYISKEAHCSSNTIQKVKEKSEQIRARKIKSARSEALRMYDNDKGYTPLDVAVKLDISADETENYKIEYWKLKNLHELEQMYKDNKESLRLIISKVHEMQARNISLDQLTHALNLLGNLPLLHKYQQWNNEIQLVTEDYKQRQDELWSIEGELVLKKMELRNTVLENNRVEQIKKMNYKELFETVANIIKEILGDENALLNAAALAIIRAIRKYPDHKTALMNISDLDSSISSYILNDSNQSVRPELIAEANVFYDDIFGELVEKVIDGMNSTLKAT